MNKPILTLIKFTEKYEYVKELQQGKLYMRSVKYYKELEDKQLNLRGDQNEGICYYGNNNEIILHLKGNDEPIRIGPKECSGPLRITRDKDLYKYIYCMYSLHIYEKDFKINDKVKEFGDWFLIITDVGEFFRRVDNKLNTLNIGYKRGLINYKDLSHSNNKISPFIKHIDFNYQQEYRIWLNYYKDSSYVLDIGDISDISIIGNTDDLFNKNIFNIQIVEK